MSSSGYLVGFEAQIPNLDSIICALPLEIDENCCFAADRDGI